MSTQHTYRSSMTLHLHDGGEFEFDLVIGFSFTPGEPELRPSYASGGEPACGPEIEIDSVRVFDSEEVERHDFSKAVLLFIEADDVLRESLIETAQEDAVAERDHHAELEADERRLGR